eukprot:722594_1
MPWLLPVTLLCIFQLNTAKLMNAKVTINKKYMNSLFTEYEIWGREFKDVANGIIEVEVVIDEAKATKISQYPEVMGFNIIHDDAEQVIHNTMQKLNNQTGWKKGMRPETFFIQYQNWDNYLEFIRNFVSDYSIATLDYLPGTTFAGETIPVITLSTSNPIDYTKPGFYLQACLHCREWIANSALTWIMHHLAVAYYDANDADHSTVVKVLEGINFFIVPTVNIDGYRYTWTTDRMWRKNRRPNGGTTSIGTDLNRNYDVSTTGCEFCGVGASSNPSSNTYCGIGAFSEFETSASRDFMSNPAYNIQAMFDMHTYSNLILYPWGYTYNTLPPADLTKFETLGQQQSDAIYAVHGQRYLPIQSSGLYPASGIAPDWAWGDQGIYGFTYEGRGTNFN